MKSVPPIVSYLEGKMSEVELDLRALLKMRESGRCVRQDARAQELCELIKAKLERLQHMALHPYHAAFYKLAVQFIDEFPSVEAPRLQLVA